MSALKRKVFQEIGNDEKIENNTQLPSLLHLLTKPSETNYENNTLNRFSDEDKLLQSFLPENVISNLDLRSIIFSYAILWIRKNIDMYGFTCRQKLFLRS